MRTPNLNIDSRVPTINPTVAPRINPNIAGRGRASASIPSPSRERRRRTIGLGAWIDRPSASARARRIRAIRPISIRLANTPIAARTANASIARRLRCGGNGGCATKKGGGGSSNNPSHGRDQSAHGAERIRGRNRRRAVARGRRCAGAPPWPGADRVAEFPADRRHHRPVPHHRSPAGGHGAPRVRRRRQRAVGAAQFPLRAAGSEEDRRPRAIPRNTRSPSFGCRRRIRWPAA